jgi:hypothetical protein
MYEVRSYYNGGDMVPELPNDHKQNYTHEGTFKHCQNAYLRAFDVLHKTTTNSGSRRYPRVDIVEIEPKIKKVIPVTFSTLRDLYDSETKDHLEIKQ